MDKRYRIPPRGPDKNKREMKKILVDYGTRKRLKEEGYGSYPTIQSALDCRTDTVVARRIRQRALQLGGVVMETEKVAVRRGVAAEQTRKEERHVCTL